MKHVIIELHRTGKHRKGWKNEFHYHVKSMNGKIMASGYGYNRKADAGTTALIVVGSAKRATIKDLT